jgi:hypothetical protein
MAIIQISKLQHRSGNLVDLPQLSDAEFGWATDTKRLFIGKSSPNENIEVLTSYSNVNFSQIIGAEGNLNISGALTGQVLSYDGNNWVNKGSTGGGVINLGDVGNVKIASGAIGYVLQTDGTGNLSWTPKGTLYTTITNLTNNPTGNVITMEVDPTVPYVNGQAVTISGGTILDAGASGNVNGHTFYLKLATNYSTTGNVTLYDDLTLLTTANGSGLTSYTANTGIATAVLSTGGAGGAGGATTSIQYNNSGIITGDANITFDFTSRIFTVNGNANVGNLNSTRVVSTVATGTTPIQVSSTTLVPNLYVARANVVDNSIITAQTTGTFYPTFVSGSTTGNYSHGSNSALSFNVATGALAATLLTGTLTTAAQPNVTSVGTLAGLVVSGHITPSANITYNLGNNTNRFNDLYLANSTIYIGAQTISANATSVTITGVIVGNVSGNTTTAGTVTTAAQPNITSVGTLSALSVTGTAAAGNLSTGGTLSVTGNANVGNLGTAGLIVATGNVTGGNLVTGGLVVATGNVTGGNLVTGGVISVTGNANVGNLGTAGLIVATGNISGANLTGTHYGAATGLTAIPGANVTGAVSFAGTANAVAGANVSGAVSFAGTANAVAGANVSGAVSFAGTANAVAGANVSGTVANATYAVTAGTANAVAGANVSGQVTFAGTANVVAGANVSGTVANATYAVTAGTANAVAGANVSGTVANATYAITAGSTTTVTTGGSVTTTVLTSGANITAGTITGNWSLSAGSKLNATYADLAECYTADADYGPGTVLEFGGTKEVTLASDATNRVAGVVSTNPAYVMNSLCPGVFVSAIALQGRAPCKVRGIIHKGDMLISGGDGFARTTNTPLMGTIIGKSLEDFNGTSGVIEVAVGRL